MRYLTGLLCALSALYAQTAEDLIAKNLQAKGGIEKIRAIQTLRTYATLQQGSFSLKLNMIAKVPDKLRQEAVIQGMTQVTAYDGSSGWQINPFQGRRDPELVGDDEMRGLVEEADFYGPLVDYEKKGSTVAYLGHDTVDGDDAYRIRVTLKNGDIIYYYLDPDTYLEIKSEKTQFIRGSIRESVTEYGSYKKVAGVYFPFSMEVGAKNSNFRASITVDRMEANAPVEDSLFQMPATPKKKAQ